MTVQIGMKMEVSFLNFETFFIQSSTRVHNMSESESDSYDDASSVSESSEVCINLAPEITAVFDNSHF